jgi:hypothetical protein
MAAELKERMGSPINGKHRTSSIVLSGQQSIDYRGHSQQEKTRYF